MEPQDNRPPGGGPTTADLTLTVVFGILQLIASFVLSALGWFQLMSVASCSERTCDYSALGAAGYLTATVSVVALIGCVSLLIVRALRRQRTWWVTGVGFAVVVLAYILATTLNRLSR